MPSPIYKTLVGFINKGIESVNTTLQSCIPEGMLTYESHTNLTIVAEEMNFIPDCLHIVRSVTTPDDKHAIIIDKVAFSQLEVNRITLEVHSQCTLY